MNINILACTEHEHDIIVQFSLKGTFHILTFQSTTVDNSIPRLQMTYAVPTKSVQDHGK